MEIQEILSYVNGSLPPLPDKRKWVEASDRISFHAKGIRPQYWNTRYTNTGVSRSKGLVTPANYEPRYQYLIDDSILNRHPNEQWEHYQWRLSTFPLVAEEVYLLAESQILGSIYQNSQYTIEALNEADEDYLWSIDFYNDVKYRIPRHVFTDPFGKIAVIEGHYDEFPESEKAKPLIELIESRYILHFKKGESIFFQSCEKHNGQKMFYWIDNEKVVRIVDEVGKSSKIVLTWYEHGIGEMPVSDNNTDFFKPFVSRADMLCRNMSDDEVITKNASYPHISMYAETCKACAGGGVIYKDCDEGKCASPCNICDGKGTTSVNPGEITLVKRNERVGNETTGDIPQQKRFDNPDISINEHSLKRVQWLEDKLLRSMNLLKVEEDQSGVAKTWDWQPMFFMLTRISEKLFDIDEDILFYILCFLNPSQREQQYKVERPTQFKIKTESDIQLEYKELATASADLVLRRQKQDELMQTSLTGNALALKRWDVVKYWDGLWGMNDSELNTAKLNGLSADYFMKHIFVDMLLQRLEVEKGYDWMIETEVTAIAAELDKLIKPMLPVSAVEPVVIE